MANLGFDFGFEELKRINDSNFGDSTTGIGKYNVRRSDVTYDENTRPVITSTEGLCVASNIWIPAALAFCANLAIRCSTFFPTTIIKSANSLRIFIKSMKFNHVLSESLLDEIKKINRTKEIKIRKLHIKV